jgi:hypothetical protein
LRELGETRFPNDLEDYCINFESLAHEVATNAITATRTIKEWVLWISLDNVLNVID